MNVKSKFVFALLIFCAANSGAQPNLAQLSMLAGDENEGFYDIYVTADGGYVACGFSSLLGADYWHPTGDALVVRFDENLNVIWSRIYGEQGQYFTPNSLIETDEGDFVLGGSHSGAFGIMKIDNNGELVWRRDYGEGIVQGVIELKNGDLVFAGTYRRMVRITPGGDVVWSHQYDGGNGRFYCLREAEDGIIAAGSAVSPGDDHVSVWAVKAAIDDGTQIWSNYCYEEGVLSARSMVATGRGGYTLTGYGQNHGTRIFQVEMTTDGEFVRADIYPEIGTENEHGKGIARLSDGGFIMVGYDNGYWPIAVRTNSSGEFRWGQVFFFRNQDVDPPIHFEAVVVNAAQEIVVCGFARFNTINAIVARFATDQPSASNMTITPSDTLVRVLPDTTIDFSVAVNLPGIDNLRFTWSRSDSVVDNDTSYSAHFESPGEEYIECRIADDQLNVVILWHVIVNSLFIASHSPDTLSLSLRRGT